MAPLRFLLARQMPIDRFEFPDRHDDPDEEDEDADGFNGPGYPVEHDWFLPRLWEENLAAEAATPQGGRMIDGGFAEWY